MRINMLSGRWAAIVAVSGAMLLSPVAQAASWKLQDLHVGAFTGSERINNLGQIVGNADVNLSNDTFLYNNGQLTLLGNLSGSADGSSWGAQINDAGLITGNSYFNGSSASFVYQGGSMTVLNSSVSDVRGLNNNNTVIGNKGADAQLLNGGVITTISLDGSRLTALGVNDAGDMVGAAFNGSSFTQSMFLYSQGQVMDLGDFGTGWASADQINNHGVILGHRSITSSGFSYDESFIFDHGQEVNLSALLGSQSFEARAINDQGQVVGVDLGNGHSYLYSNGGMIDLSAYGITSVSDINEKGQIVGHSLATGNLAILEISAVPEPSAAIMLLGGLLLLALAYRRRA